MAATLVDNYGLTQVWDVVFDGTGIFTLNHSMKSNKVKVNMLPLSLAAGTNLPDVTFLDNNSIQINFRDSTGSLRVYIENGIE